MWIIVSLLNGRCTGARSSTSTSLFTRVLTSNIIAVSITALIMYTLREYSYSRTIVLGTAMLATILELIFGSVYIAYKKALSRIMKNMKSIRHIKNQVNMIWLRGQTETGHHTEEPAEVNPGIVNAIEKECGSEMTRQY